MSTPALALVLASAVLHASWNLLAKRSRGSEVFLWQALVVSSAAFLVPFLVLLARNPIPPQGWGWIAATGALHTLYFHTLGAAYRRGDLSLVYPIARGLGPALVLVVSIVVLGERIAGLGLAGVLAVIVGVYVVNVRIDAPDPWLGPLRRLAHPHGRYAAATGVLIAAYTLVDKQGVQVVHPLVYVYLLFVLSTAGVTAALLARPRARSALRTRHGWGRAALVAVLWVAAYALVLAALEREPAPYVAAAREISIVLGAVFGVWLLGEPARRERLVGAACIAAGVVMIALA